MGSLMEHLWRYLPAIILLLQLFMGWALWSLRKEFMTKKDCESCRGGIKEAAGALERRVMRSEDTLERMPGTGMVHNLALAIERLSGDVQTLGQQTKGLTDLVERVERVVARHEEHLLHGGR